MARIRRNNEWARSGGGTVHLFKNDVVIGCQLCMIAPAIPANKVATEQH